MWYSEKASSTQHPNAADVVILNDQFYRDIIEAHKPTENQPTGDDNSERQTEEPLDDNPPSDPPKRTKNSRELVGLETSPRDAWKLPAEVSHWNHSGKDTLAESAQLALQDESFGDMIAIYTAAAISDNNEDGIDQKSYKAANESQLGEKWDMATKAELDSIGRHRVFGHFVELPDGRMAFPNQWVYKIKRHGAGNVQRFKARVVSEENHQIKGIDYQATYALTASLGHGRLALAIAARYDLEIHQMDVSTAFLGVDFDEDINMHPPQGYFRLDQICSRYHNPRSTNTLRTIVLRLR